MYKENEIMESFPFSVPSYHTKIVISIHSSFINIIISYWFMTNFSFDALLDVFTSIKTLINRYR